MTERHKYLLAIYTLFHIEGSQAGKVRSVMEQLTGEPLVDFKRHVADLCDMGYLETTSYNWRTDTYDYRLVREKMIPMMQELYKDEPDRAVAVLKACKGLKPTVIQQLVWEYITSDYRNINIERLSNYEVGENIDIFLPATVNPHFASFIMLFSAEHFYELVNTTLRIAFAEESIIDIDYLRSLIKSYRNEGSDNDREKTLSLCDLYAYLVSGSVPRTLLIGNSNHRIIAGIYAAYHGDFVKALDHFKKALVLGGRRQAYYSLAHSFLPTAIANFYFVLVAFRAGTEDGRKKALAISKSAERDVTLAAKVLHAILYGTTTEKQLMVRLQECYRDGDTIDRILTAIMARYLGKSVALGIDNIRPRWGILRKEDSTEGILHNIVLGQKWEDTPSVAHDLVIQHHESTKPVRIGYFTTSTRQRTTTVRQQAVLKSGAWGAGKKVSMQSFLNDAVDGMSPVDKQLTASLREEHPQPISVPMEKLLPLMVEESRLYVGRYSPYTLVEVTEDMPYLNVHRDDAGFTISSNVPLEEVENPVIITHRGVASINFIRLSDRQRPYYRRLLALEHIPFDEEPRLRSFLRKLGGTLEINSDLLEGGSTLPITEGKDTLVLQMRPQERDTYAVGIFCRPLADGRMRVTPGRGNEIIVDGEGDKRTRVKRDLKKEKENFRHFIDTVGRELVPDKSDSFTIDVYNLLSLLDYARQHPDRMVCEWPEGAKVKLKYRHTSSAWHGTIRKNENGWFTIEGSVELDQGRVVTMSQLLDLASRSRGRFIRLDNGEFLALSEQLRKQLMQLNTVVSRSHGTMRISPFSAALLGSELMSDELVIEEDEEMKAIRQRIIESSNYTPEIPRSLHATLREYQKEGYQWMARLNRWGAGALLADDMGLGKTIQTITFLLQKASEGPALVIAPASVAPNWLTEFEKFAPSLNVTMLNFAFDRADVVEKASAGDVVVTTYGLLLSVKEEVTSKHWTTICLDEAHIIKNRGAKTSAVAMKLHSDNRVMLTGTPVQNHLGELWNLFQFVNPGLLGSFEDFNRRFIVPIEQWGDRDVQHELDRLVKPFMLRRTKEKVARELPEKEEIYQRVTLSEEEQLVYEALRQQAETLLLADGLAKVSLNTLAEITRLRQCACDIRLVQGASRDDAPEGSKIIALTELLQTIIEGDAHALVFSQFTSYLSLVRRALDKAGIPYLYIDGSIDIKTRQKLVKQFQDGEVPVFLISLKAGGLGLNLTRANYVIHMDPWWNPAIEAQATDRAHRIGQHQAVTVYHLIAEGTIEEKIRRMHQRKQALVEDILASTDMSHRLTGVELLQMVSR